MLKILAIETSSQACSVALIECDGRESTVTQEFTDVPRQHTQQALPMVDKVLLTAGVTLEELDALAFSAGPGSFTGLRIGLGLVQGLAFGASLPVIAISTLQVLAQGARRKFQITDEAIIVPAFDARMSEIYWGAYQVTRGIAQAIATDSLSAPALVANELLPSNNFIGVGEGWQFAEQFPNVATSVYVDLQPQAFDLAELALIELKLGNTMAVEDAQLVYLRESVSWQKRQRLRC